MKRVFHLHIQNKTYGRYQITSHYLWPRFQRLLCRKVLKQLFDLSDNPQKIKVVLNTVPTRNSYFIKSLGRYATTITLSNGKLSRPRMYPDARELIYKLFPEGCYVSVIA